MANKITGCVFDLDGTLADTAPDIALALNKSLNDFGLRQVPLESVKGMIGNGIPVWFAGPFPILKHRRIL